MASDELYSNETKSADVHFLDLSLSAMAYYPYPYLPMIEEDGSDWVLSVSDETRYNKRIKRSMSVGESVGSNNSGCISRSSSTGSLSSLPKLHFRDHIWTYTQRYLATEAVEAASYEAEEGVLKQYHALIESMNFIHRDFLYQEDCWSYKSYGYKLKVN